MQDDSQQKRENDSCPPSNPNSKRKPCSKRALEKDCDPTGGLEQFCHAPFMRQRVRNLVLIRWFARPLFFATLKFTSSGLFVFFKAADVVTRCRHSGAEGLLDCGGCARVGDLPSQSFSLFLGHS